MRFNKQPVQLWIYIHTEKDTFALNVYFFCKIKKKILAEFIMSKANDGIKSNKRKHDNL